MLVKRRSEIVNYLKVKQSATLEELCGRFSVSINTIRRDVDELESEGLLKKVYGGVILAEKKVVIPMSVRQLDMAEEKERIGRAAAELVRNNDVVIIDAGSTTVRMINYLKDKSLTIITNSVNVLNEALPYENLKVIMAGGTLSRDTNSMTGKEVTDLLSKFNANIAFVAATGVSQSRGLTNSSIAEADIKTSIIKAAEKNVLMADHTKFGVVSLVSFAQVSDFDYLITDSRVDSEFMEYAEKNKVQMIIAE